MSLKDFTTWIRNEAGYPARIIAKEGRVEIISPASLEEGDTFLDVIRGPVENLNKNADGIKYTSVCKEGTNEEFQSRAAEYFRNDGSVKSFLRQVKNADCENGTLIIDLSKMSEIFSE